jgi:RsiW-degrading membrane proteinase PrsW (M82 family)
MLWEQMQYFLKSWFIYPNLGWKLMLVGIGLALAFAAIWLLCHWPPLFRRHWLWAVGVFSAFFTVLAIAFVQVPLQYYVGQALTHFWSVQTLNNWLLLAGLPSVLLSGFVQEGAKMVPVVAWWWRRGRNIDPKVGLAIGAIAGAGFGIFEGFWVHANVLSSGWTFGLIGDYGFLAITPFWERLFTIGFHIAASSLVGYGLAKGRGWQFYLIAGGLHSLLNYVTLPFSKGYLTVNQSEIYVAVVALLVTALVLWLRWCKRKEEEPIPPVEPVVPPVGTVETTTQT